MPIHLNMRSLSGKRWSDASTSTNLGRGPKSDGLCQDTIKQQRLIVSASGLLIPAGTPISQPLNVAFVEGSIAYLRVLAGHRIRIKRDMKKLDLIQKEIKRNVRVVPKGEHASPHYYLPGQRSFKDLKVCECAGCSRTLLGDSEKALKALCEAKGYSSAKRLPPLVAGRLNDRPYCVDCLKLLTPVV